MSTMHAPAPVAPARQDLRIPAILAALGGRFGWRFWWPLAVWLADAATVATFRPNALTEPAGIIVLATLVAVGVLWVWGARFAVALGHRRRSVMIVTAVASVVLGLANQAVAAVARLIEVSAVGAENAKVFVGTLGKGDDPSRFFGFTESLYLLYGLPLLGVVVLASCWAVGRGLLAGLAAAAAGALGMWLWLTLWGAVDAMLPNQQAVTGGVGALIFVAACAALGWLGFRRVAIA